MLGEDSQPRVLDNRAPFAGFPIAHMRRVAKVLYVVERAIEIVFLRCTAVDYDDSAAWLDHSRHFADAFADVRIVVRRLAHRDYVEGGVRKWQRLGRTLAGRH